MADAPDPYAPPVADVATPRPAGESLRDGKRVRMDRAGQLPGRCVSCNAPATTHVSRTAYWLPLPWRVAPPAILVGLVAGAILGVPFAAEAFWPAVLLAIVLNLVVRRRVDLEVPVCGRHAWGRRAATLALVAAFCGVWVLLFVAIGVPGALSGDATVWIAMALLAVTFAAGLSRSFSAPERIRVARMTADHVWLKGAGRAFRESLPAAGER